jgi:hypothetical protein
MVIYADGHDLILTSLLNGKCQGKMAVCLPRRLFRFLQPCAVTCTSLHPWVTYIPPGLTIKNSASFTNNLSLSSQYSPFPHSTVPFLTVQSLSSEYSPFPHSTVPFLIVQSRLSVIMRPTGSRITGNVGNAEIKWKCSRSTRVVD